MSSQRRAVEVFAGVSLLCVALTAMACGGSKTHPAPATDAGASDAGPSADASVAPEDAGDAGVEVDASVDAGPMDAASEDAGFPDAGIDAGIPDSGDGGSMCSSAPHETYTCTPNDPSTCPGGICIVSWCVGQVVDGGQYASCGNGTCDPCETAESCPADCAPPPVLSGRKQYHDAKTISVWVHGFRLHTASSLQNVTYGSMIPGCAELGSALQVFAPNVPCATGESDTTVNQAAAVEYYGAQPPDWMTPQDIAEVEQYPYLGGPTGLQRYGLIVAKFIKWRLAVTGADYANIACHSMGCLLTRYIIENDLEHLASQQKIVRWETNAGVIAGARLARLYDNPNVAMYSNDIGLATDDFALMNPAYVQQYAASYDHQLYEANSPLYAGILIHHLGGTDPFITGTNNLVDVLDTTPNENPGDEANDSIMFTNDEYFHSQKPQASVQTPSGQVVSATHSFIYVSHTEVPKVPEAGALMVAGLFHQRKVIVTLSSITLKKDFEFHADDPSTLGETGTPPAEVVAQTQVDYNAYTMPMFGVPSVVDNDTIAYRSAQMFQQTQGTTLTPNEVIFEAPVFDDQTTFHLTTRLTETDYYPTVPWKVLEAPSTGFDKEIISYDGEVTLMNQMIPVSNSNATVQYAVSVVDMY